MKQGFYLFHIRTSKSNQNVPINWTHSLYISNSGRIKFYISTVIQRVYWLTSNLNCNHFISPPILHLKELINSSINWTFHTISHSMFSCNLAQLINITTHFTCFQTTNFHAWQHLPSTGTSWNSCHRKVIMHSYRQPVTVLMQSSMHVVEGSAFRII